MSNMKKMPEENNLIGEEVLDVKNRPVMHITAISLLVLVLLAATVEVVVLVHNNKSISSDEKFKKKLVLAIDRAESWINVHQMDILQMSGIICWVHITILQKV